MLCFKACSLFQLSFSDPFAYSLVNTYCVSIEQLQIDGDFRTLPIQLFSIFSPRLSLVFFWFS